ncbi:MAG: hypothetical protein ACXQTS_00995 [Candidatus Methanospirareceae archaeon]
MSNKKEKIIRIAYEPPREIEIRALRYCPTLDEFITILQVAGIPKVLRDEDLLFTYYTEANKPTSLRWVIPEVIYCFDKDIEKEIKMAAIEIPVITALSSLDMKIADFIKYQHGVVYGDEENDEQDDK